MVCYSDAVPWYQASDRGPVFKCWFQFWSVNQKVILIPTMVPGIWIVHRSNLLYRSPLLWSVWSLLFLSSNYYNKFDLLEDGKCEAGFCDRVPRPLHQMLELGGSQTSEKYFSHQLSQKNDENEGLHVDNSHAEIMKNKIKGVIVDQWLACQLCPRDRDLNQAWREERFCTFLSGIFIFQIAISFEHVYQYLNWIEIIYSGGSNTEHLNSELFKIRFSNGFFFEW